MRTDTTQRNVTHLCGLPSMSLAPSYAFSICKDRYYTEECDSLEWTSVDVVGPVVRLQYLK